MDIEFAQVLLNIAFYSSFFDVLINASFYFLGVFAVQRYVLWFLLIFEWLVIILFRTMKVIFLTRSAFT